MADLRETLDIRGLLQQEFGLRIVGGGSQEGMVQVEFEQEEQVPTNFGPGEVRQRTRREEIDLNDLLKSEFDIDPTQFNLQLSTPESPVDESPLNFMDRVFFEVARRPVDKQRFLAKQFGEENVQQTKDGDLLVNNNGVWQNASSTGLAGFIGAEADVLAASIAGGAAGFAVGGPLGAAAGSSLAAMITRMTTKEIAEAQGLRTEQDAIDTLEEIGTEGLFALASEVGALGLKVIGRGGKFLISKQARAFEKMARTLGSDNNKFRASSVISDLTGKDSADVLASLKDPKAVKKFTNETFDFLAKGSKGENPVRQKMGALVEDVADKAKSHMFKDYENTLKPLKPILDDVQVDLKPVIDDTLKQIEELGLIDAEGKWLTNQQRELAKIASPRAVGKIRQAFRVIDGASKAVEKSGTGNVSFEQARTLIRNLDEVLEASGAFNQASPEISTAAVREIKQIRGRLDDVIKSSLEAKSPESLKIYEGLNSKYSSRREWLDELAKGLRDNKIDSTVTRLTDPRGQRQRGQLADILADTPGLDPDKIMDTLSQMRAGIQLAPSPVGTAERGLISRTLGAGASKLSQSTFQTLNKTAEMVKFLQGMSGESIEAALKNPVLLRGLTQSTARSIQLEEQLNQQLESQLGGQQ